MASGMTSCSDPASSSSERYCQIKEELASVTHDLTKVEEQLGRDESRLALLLNADVARQDFYEIRSQKQGEIRRIIINNNAEIIYDSEASENTSQDLPDFDEIDERFLQVIPDTREGREYYRSLRGLLQTEERERRQLKKEKQQATEKAKQLRRAVIDNFQQQDCVEREAEITDILDRKEFNEQQQSSLQAQKESLLDAMVLAHKRMKEEELERKAAEEALAAAKRKQEHDRKRNAWLDRFDPPPRAQANAESCCADSKKASDDEQSECDQSEVTTECGECNSRASDIDDDI